MDDNQKKFLEAHNRLHDALGRALPEIVYTLEHSVDYEGKCIIGVYSTLEAAKAAGAKYRREYDGIIDNLEINPITMDADAATPPYEMTEYV